MRLPVRTALLQNEEYHRKSTDEVRLPVRTALLQNAPLRSPGWIGCDYQSERHCSKTADYQRNQLALCDYQSERHCSKTRI